MTDPMDAPPTDYGSDRYDYVEIEGPGVPTGEWFDKLIEQPCADCRANVFVRRREVIIKASDRRAWDVKIAHDDGCPVLARKERDR